MREGRTWKRLAGAAPPLCCPSLATVAEGGTDASPSRPEILRRLISPISNAAASVHFHQTTELDIVRTPHRNRAHLCATASAGAGQGGLGRARVGEIAFLRRAPG